MLPYPSMADAAINLADGNCKQLQTKIDGETPSQDCVIASSLAQLLFLLMVWWHRQQIAGIDDDGFCSTGPWHLTGGSTTDCQTLVSEKQVQLPQWLTMRDRFQESWLKSWQLKCLRNYKLCHHIVIVHTQVANTNSCITIPAELTSQQWQDG